MALLLALFCLASAATAATSLFVSGQTLERGTRKPLPGTYIVVRENETLNAVSDEQGRFTLELPQPGRYTLTAATLGGSEPVSREIVVPANGPLPQPVFYLAGSSVLPEVLVRGERSPDRVSKSVISGQELRRLPGSSGDPLRGLQTLPGVNAVGSGSAPAVRGSGPGDNLYYVDGLPVSKLFHFGGAVSVLNGDLIQDFNLYSAAFAPRYGDATGAVLDVALREPRHDRLGGKANINLTGADFLIEGPTSVNQAFYFAARRSYFDLLLKQVSQNGVTLQIPNYSDYQGKYLWQPNPSDRMIFALQGATDELRLAVGGDADLARQQPLLSGDLSFSDRYAMQSVLWEHSLLNDAQNKLAYQHFTSRLDNLLAGAGNLILTQDVHEIRELLRLPLAGKHELVLGGSFSQRRTGIIADLNIPNCTQFNPSCDLSSAPRRQLEETLLINNWELSLQDRIQLTSRLNFSAGLHHSGEDYLHRAYTEPRLGLEFDWDPRTMLTAGWGWHNQFPVGQQVSPQFGNPGLDHLRAEHRVLGIAQKLDEDWSWKAEGYYKLLHNLVVDDPRLNYVNGGSGTAYGLELLVKKEANSDFSGWLSVSLARSERHNDLTGESFRFQYDQPINTTLVAQHRLNDDWTMGAKWNYHSGTPYTPVIGSHPDTRYPGRVLPDYAPVNSATLPDYHRLDLRFDRNFVFDTWKLNTYFEINNVYFRQNVSGYRYDATYTRKEPVTPLVIPFSFGIQGEF